MDSEDFNLGVNKLMEIAKQNQTAIMCAGVFWFNATAADCLLHRK
jgi:hypothetical protein